MRLGLTNEEVELRTAFEDFFGREAGPDVARGAEPLGYDEELWQKFVATGAAAMATSVGGEASLAQMAIVAHAAGRALAPLPIVDHLVATGLAPGLDSSSPIGFAPLAAEGNVARAVPSGAAVGSVVGLIDDKLVVVHRVAPRPLIPNLASLPIADVSLDDPGQVVLAEGPGALSAFAKAQARWRTLTAAQLVGAAQAALELGRSYALSRKQFGVVIGSFQALQHNLADVPGLIDGAELLTAKAAWAIDSAPAPIIDLTHNDIDDPHVLAAMAYVFAGRVAREATKRSLQCHGGYGYSAEYDIQLYYRRVRGWSLMGGGRSELTHELAHRLKVAH